MSYEVDAVRDALEKVRLAGENDGRIQQIAEQVVAELHRKDLRLTSITGPSPDD